MSLLWDVDTDRELRAAWRGIHRDAPLSEWWEFNLSTMTQRAILSEDGREIILLSGYCTSLIDRLHTHIPARYRRFEDRAHDGVRSRRWVIRLNAQTITALGKVILRECGFKVHQSIIDAIRIYLRERKEHEPL